MKIQESAEDYLETIYMLEKKNGSVRSIDVANNMGFSKPSVSIAMKNLRENGYVNVDKDGYLSLSSKGEAIAVKMYERHMLLSRLLISLGVDEETAYADACRVEHVLSVQSFDAIKKHMTKE